LKDWKARSTEKEDMTGKIQVDLEKSSVITWNGLPAGEDIDKSPSVIIVEGRNDVQQLLKIGVKNTIAVNGTSIPKIIIDLTEQKECTVFLDGDRGGDMILNELIQVSKIKYVARAPPNREVEELNEKELVNILQNRVPIELILKERKQQEQEQLERNRRDRDGRDRHHDRYSRDEGKGPSKESRAPRDRRPGGHGGRIPQPIAIPRQYADIVKGLISSNEAIGLDGTDQQAMKTSNVNIINELNENIKTIILDGVVSQRFLEKALAQKIKRIIAVNASENLNFPENAPIEIFFFKDFL
jgi:5S rRNA maturation endonuclease (ribonuclease M5)